MLERRISFRVRGLFRYAFNQISTVDDDILRVALSTSLDILKLAIAQCGERVIISYRGDIFRKRRDDQLTYHMVR